MAAAQRKSIIPSGARLMRSWVLFPLGAVLFSFLPFPFSLLMKLVVCPKSGPSKRSIPTNYKVNKKEYLAGLLRGICSMHRMEWNLKSRCVLHYRLSRCLCPREPKPKVCSSSSRWNSTWSKLLGSSGLSLPWLWLYLTITLYIWF